MRCTYHRLVKDLDRGEVYPVYFFYGREQLLKEEALQSLIQRLVPPELRDFNLDILYGDETDAAQVIDRVSALPMMAERRVVVVRNVDQLSAVDRRRLLEHLSPPFSHTCLILTAPDVDVRRGFYRSLEGVACHVKFDYFTESETSAWVGRRALKYGKSMTREATQVLCDSIGEDLIALDNEIQKLVLYVGDRETIGPGDVGAVVGELRARTVFELCDAIGSRDLPRALTLLSSLLEASTSPGHMIGAIRRHICRLARVRDLSERRRSPEQDVEGLHVPRKYMGKYMRQVTNFDEQDLESMFTHLYETELRLKRGGQEMGMAMTLLVYHLCRSRGGRGDERS
jgi:DNA polymerase-3 subunit delta